MDFVRYAEQAARLVNASVDDRESLVAALPGRDWLFDEVTDADAAAMTRFGRELRPIFEAGSAGDEQAVVDQVNALLAKHPVTPYVAGPAGSWHLHVADRQSSVAQLLVAESLMGLAILACDYGPARLGVCASDSCDQAYVDTSPNRSRRYCSDRCSSRANVAAYRARQRESRTTPTESTA